MILKRAKVALYCHVSLNFGVYEMKQARQSRFALISLFFNIGEIGRNFAIESPETVHYGHLKKFALLSKKGSFLARNGCSMAVNWLKTIY